MTTFRELQHLTEAALTPVSGEAEARWQVRTIMEEITGRTRTDLLIDADKEVSDFRRRQIMAAVERVRCGEPVQYVLGFTRFMGLRIGVNPAVLIPRPETAELVNIIIDKVGQAPDLNILDLGSGSGCISLALARQLPFSHVTGLDISQGAVDTAASNVRDLKIGNATFQCGDMLSWTPRPKSLDIVVSNPPYVLESEKAEMENTVVDHEPATALFVPDDDPLRFYHAAVRIAREGLKEGGLLAMECNPLTIGSLLDEMRRDPAWRDVDSTRDSQKRLRFLTAIRSDAV